MSDLETILLTAGATVLGGVVVFVVGQVLTRFVIEPLHEQRKVIGAIADALLYHAHYFADSGRPAVQELSELNAAADQFRRLASELTAKSVAIPGYPILAWLGVVRPYDRVLTARRALWGLANTLVRPDWEIKLRRASEAARALRIAAIDEGLFRDWGEEKHGDPRRPREVPPPPTLRRCETPASRGHSVSRGVANRGLPRGTVRGQGRERLIPADLFGCREDSKTHAQYAKAGCSPWRQLSLGIRLGKAPQQKPALGAQGGSDSLNRRRAMSVGQGLSTGP